MSGRLLVFVVVIVLLSCLLQVISVNLKLTLNHLKYVLSPSVKLLLRKRKAPAGLAPAKRKTTMVRRTTMVVLMGHQGGNLRK